MNIFKKRPLMLILCIILGGFSLFLNTTRLIRVIFALLSLAVFIFSFFIKGKFNLNFTRICFAAICFSIVFAELFSTFSYPNKYYGDEVQVEGVITKIDYVGVGVTKLTMEVDKINGDKTDLKILVKGEYNRFKYLKNADRISLKSNLSPIEDEGGNFNSKSYYLGKGYKAVCDKIESFDVISSDNKNIALLLSDLRTRTRDFFENETNNQTGGLISALITGDRTSLDRNTSLNFKRIGISHILALSGMHLAIISFAVTKILSLFKMGKKAKYICVSLFCLGYMTLTGFSPSVTRAGIMLITTSLLFILSSSKDSLTNLSVAVFLIVLISPYSVHDISLWLSASSTLGIICYYEIRSKKKRSKNIALRCLSFLFGSFVASVFAISASLIFIVTSFDELSIVAPFTTVIFTFFAQIIIYSGLLMLMSFGYLPLGKITVVLSDTMKELAERISDFKLVQVSSDYLIPKILSVLLVICFFCFIVFNFKKKTVPIVILSVLFASVFVSAYTINSINLHKNCLKYEPEAKGDMFLMKSETQTGLVYSGSSIYGSDKKIREVLEEEKLMYLDCLIFPNYSKSMNSVSMNIISNCKTRYILIPKPKNQLERDLCEQLAQNLSVFGTDLKFYNEKQEICIGEYSYRLIDHQEMKDRAYVQNILLFKCNGKYINYNSKGFDEYPNLEMYYTANGADTVIFGTQGNAYSKDYEFKLKLNKAKEIYFGVEVKIAPNIAKFYKEKGVPIKYTDTPLFIEIN